MGALKFLWLSLFGDWNITSEGNRYILTPHRSIEGIEPENLQVCIALDVHEFQSGLKTVSTLIMQIKEPDRNYVFVAVISSVGSVMNLSCFSDKLISREELILEVDTFIRIVETFPDKPEHVFRQIKQVFKQLKHTNRPWVF